MPRVTCPFEGVEIDDVLVIFFLLWSEPISTLLSLCNRHPHVLITSVEMTRWLVRENFLGDIFAKDP